MLDMEGRTVKCPVADCPSGFVTLTFVPAISAGTITLMLVAELTVTEVAGVEPKTTVAPG